MHTDKVRWQHYHTWHCVCLCATPHALFHVKEVAAKRRFHWCLLSLNRLSPGNLITSLYCFTESTLKDFLSRCAKQKRVKKKIEDALQTFHMVRQVPHLPYSCWTHFKIPFQQEDKKIQGAASVLGETLPLSSPQSWECMLLFNKPRTRLLAHKQRRRCIIHFGGVAEGQSVSDAQPVPSHENISPPNSVSRKFKDKQTELPSTSRTVRGWEAAFNRQLHDSRKTQTRWTRGTKAKMSFCL